MVRNFLLQFANEHMACSSNETHFFSFADRFKLRIRGIQVDNQLPFSIMPVLLRPQRVGDEDVDAVLNFSMTMQSDGSLDLCVYPYIGLQVYN